MIEILKEWSVPGGLLTIVVGALVGYLRRPPDAPKTSTADVHRAEAEQVAKDTGLEDEWRKWALHVEQSTGEQLKAALIELDKARVELRQALNVNNVLTGYAWQLRADITTYGHTPRPWPVQVDPDIRESDQLERKRA